MKKLQRRNHDSTGNASARRERAGWENSARSRNQSDCRICWIPPAHALRKKIICYIYMISSFSWKNNLLSFVLFLSFHNFAVHCLSMPRVFSAFISSPSVDSNASQTAKSPRSQEILPQTILATHLTTQYTADIRGRGRMYFHVVFGSRWWWKKKRKISWTSPTVLMHQRGN